jgi:drug/metabolite transporter (DMT)-like permease
MHRKALLFLIIGLQAATTSILFIKASTIEPITLASYRLFTAAVFLTPLYIIKVKKHPEHFSLKQLKKTFLPGLFLAVHFILWLTGGRMTPSANATMIINLTAVVMPFLLFFFAKEKINRKELTATLIISAGLILLGIFDFNLDPRFLTGDLICFAGMLFLALYLIMAKINHDIPDIWLYVIPIYYIAGVICLAAAFLFENPLQIYAPKEYLYAAGLGLIPTVIGHSAYNYAMRNLRGQLVGILNTTQFILAGIWAFFLFRETPNISFYLISPIILMGSVYAVLSARERVKQQKN